MRKELSQQQEQSAGVTTVIVATASARLGSR